ncbi:hypothetical protein R6Q59_006861 [Mikania micrantha]
MVEVSLGIDLNVTPFDKTDDTNYPHYLPSIQACSFLREKPITVGRRRTGEADATKAVRRNWKVGSDGGDRILVAGQKSREAPDVGSGNESREGFFLASE